MTLSKQKSRDTASNSMTLSSPAIATPLLQHLPRCVSLCQTNETTKDHDNNDPISLSLRKKASSFKKRLRSKTASEDKHSNLNNTCLKKVKMMNIPKTSTFLSNDHYEDDEEKEQMMQQQQQPGQGHDALEDETMTCPASPQSSVVSCDGLGPLTSFDLHEDLPLKGTSPSNPLNDSQMKCRVEDEEEYDDDKYHDEKNFTKRREEDPHVVSHENDSNFSTGTATTVTSNMISFLDTTTTNITTSIPKDNISDQETNVDNEYLHDKSLNHKLAHLPQDLQIHLRGLRIEANLSSIKVLLFRLIIHPTYNRRGTFNIPVDQSAYDLKDYFTIIKKPMDLGTIKTKLLSNIYTHHSQVARDIRLVFTNACTFNPPKHPVHEAAKGLLEYFEDGYSKILLQAAPILTEQQEDHESTATIGSNGSKLMGSPLAVPLVWNELSHQKINSFVSSNLPPIKHICTACEGCICPICEEGCQPLEHSLLICSGHQCLGSKIRRGINYYCSVDGTKTWCQKCYSNLPPTLSNEDDLDGTTILKRDLVKRKNDEDVVEKWITCNSCRRKVHRVCAFASEFFTDENEFICPLCNKSTLPQQAIKQRLAMGKETERKARKVYSFLSGKDNPELVEDFIAGTYMDARHLPACNIASFIEIKVKERMVELDCPKGAEQTLTVRVIGDYSKEYNLHDSVLKHFRRAGARKESKFKGIIEFEQPSCSVNYQSKVIAMFQRIDGMDVCIFSMFVQEYDECTDDPTQKKRIYIAYIDSVEHFRPRSLRTHIYREILMAYLATAKMRSFEYVHIWSCPPTRGNSFVFWIHPPSQRTPSRDRLLAWYRNALSLCMEYGVVSNIQSLYDHSFEPFDHSERTKKNLPPIHSLIPCPPILEGDFWVEETNRIYTINLARLSKSQKKTGDTIPDFSPSTVFSGLHSPSPIIQLTTMVENFLMKHPFAEPFLRPVNPILLGLHDYHEIIQTPMDFGTIFTRCILGEYDEFHQICSDLDLVFENAMKYNPKDHPVHKKAEEMKKYSIDLLSSLTEYWSSIGIEPRSAENNTTDDSPKYTIYQHLSMKLSTVIESKSNVELCAFDASHTREALDSNWDIKDPDTILKDMVGNDVWLLDKRHDNKKKIKMKKEHPVDHNRREYWIGNEVLSAVRKLRTDFFVCKLGNLTDSKSAEGRDKIFATYVKNFRPQKQTSEKRSHSTTYTKPEVGESRHGLLELSQYCNFQFDTIRRAKYSTSMLLYYLQNPSADGIVPVCSLCFKDICNVRWHKTNRAFDERRRGSISLAIRTACVEMSREEICGACYEQSKKKEDYIPIRVSYSRA